MYINFTIDKHHFQRDKFFSLDKRQETRSICHTIRPSPSFYVLFYFYILPIHWAGCQKTASSIKSVVSDPINVTSPPRARKVERRENGRNETKSVLLGCTYRLMVTINFHRLLIDRIFFTRFFSSDRTIRWKVRSKFGYWKGLGNEGGSEKQI